MKLVKFGVFALALGLFAASCNSEKTESSTTNSDSTAAMAPAADTTHMAPAPAAAPMADTTHMAPAAAPMDDSSKMMDNKKMDAKTTTTKTTKTEMKSTK